MSEMQRELQRDGELMDACRWTEDMQFSSEDSWLLFAKRRWRPRVISALFAKIDGSARSKDGSARSESAGMKSLLY